jgi:hypothetical protein
MIGDPVIGDGGTRPSDPTARRVRRTFYLRIRKDRPKIGNRCRVATQVAAPAADKDLGRGAIESRHDAQYA